MPFVINIIDYSNMSRIILLRHGKPAVDLVGMACAADLAQMAAAYNAAGIVDQPPPAVLHAVGNADIVLCSDLLRAQESARALGFAEVYTVEVDMREAAIPHFASGSIKLPVSVWLLVLRILWLAGFSRNGESYAAARSRARQAAARLVALAERHASVLLVGHGVMNYLIARELRASGWQGPAKPGKRFWDYGVYRCSPEQNARNSG